MNVNNQRDINIYDNLKIHTTTPFFSPLSYKKISREFK